MGTEIGEYVVGACLKLLKLCDFVDYNVRRPGGGLAGLNEIDVIGLDLKTKTAYLCEGTTHLDGLLYKNYPTTVARVRKKYEGLRDYAEDFLSDFPNRHFMFWSPVVRESTAIGLREISGLEVVINRDYTAYVRLLQELARTGTHDTGNPTFRVLQILGHLRQ